MNQDKKLSLPNRIMAFIFALMVLASFAFIGYRIITKSAYEARELKQTQLLSVSAIETIAEKSHYEPEMWNKFETDEFVLIIDHKKIEGNWVIQVRIKRHPDHIEIESSASSGWNSRRPKNTVFNAKISNDGIVIYADRSASEIAKELKNIKININDKSVVFGFPDEIKVCPVTINAAVTSYKDKPGNRLIALKYMPNKTAK